MAENKQNKRPNVPPLRFSEFTEPWESSTIGECCSSLEYGMNAAAKEFDGINRYIRITDIDENTSTYSNQDVVSPSGVLEDKYLVRENDILFARTGASVGKTYHYDKTDGKLYYAGFLIRGGVLPYFNSKFIFYQTQLSRYKKWVTIMSARSGQPGINSQEYECFNLFIPTRTEQDKIATFIELLDKRIAVQSKLIEDLKQLKSALYQQVFSSMHGQAVALSNIADIIKGKQINGTELFESGDYYVMNGGILPSGYYNDFNTPANTISISEGGNSCGYVQFNDMPFWSGGHCYTLQITSNQLDLRYLFHFLKHREQDIMALRIGSGLPNIQKKDLERFQILVPTVDEQQRYAKFFDCLQRKEDIEASILNQWLLQKQYLLGQMFI